MTLLEMSAALIVFASSSLAVTSELATDLYSKAEIVHYRATAHQADLIGQSYYLRYGHYAETCSDLVATGYISSDDASPENCQIIEAKLRELTSRALLQEGGL